MWVGRNKDEDRSRLFSTAALILFELTWRICSTEGLPPDKPLPSYLRVCRRNNPDLNRCIRNSINTLISNIKSGAEEMELPPLDPLAVPLVDLSQSSNNLSIQLVLRDVSIQGISQTIVGSVKANLDELKIEVASKTPFFDIEGIYSCEGGVLSFPLSSQGSFYVNMTDVTAVWILYLKEVSLLEETYLTVDQFGLDVIPSDIRYSFGEQLDGDNRLGQAMNMFLNENSHEIFNDLKPRTTAILSGLFADIADHVLASYPVSRLLPGDN